VAVDLDQHQPEHDHKVRVTKEIDDDGATTLRLTTEVDEDEPEVVFVILADDGSTAYSADVLDSNEVTVPCTMFEPGLYRSFAWVRDRPEGPSFHTPVCGPVIRVSA
ncbi:MAG: hypothetical protein R3246_13125, partial [Acidimicrobiia bacterium]|nr:hypothetical protein [Acidimicrobiia bacterium]